MCVCEAVVKAGTHLKMISLHIHRLPHCRLHKSSLRASKWKAFYLVVRAHACSAVRFVSSLCCCLCLPMDGLYWCDTSEGPLGASIFPPDTESYACVEHLFLRTISVCIR